MLKEFDIKPFLTPVNNPQVNTPVDQVHQVILNMLVTKDPDNKWEIRDFYHRTIMATPGQAVFIRDILFDLASVV